MAYMDEYKKWLEMFADDEATVSELKSIEGNDAEIEDRFYRELEFGTAGMRGVIGMGLNRMNIHNVRRVTAALAKFVNAYEGGAERGIHEVSRVGEALLLLLGLDGGVGLGARQVGAELLAVHLHHVIERILAGHVGEVIDRKSTRLNSSHVT